MILNSSTTRQLLIGLGQIEENRQELKAALELMDEERIVASLQKIETAAKYLQKDAAEILAGRD